ncbi:MAG: 7-carboxy-7-deazaguanine synthase QueE [Bacteroidia bacterium]|nr:7-carboxy-7-deazaguanine synthase QueE [Bacteroidia bacterium]
MLQKLRAKKDNVNYRQANPLPVMEQFYTLQGEGFWTGTPAYFIRLAGCDVGCHWCDVKESWDPAEEQYQEVELIAQTAKDSGAERVVITGGEPSIYDLTKLCDALHALGLKVHMETAGPHAASGEIDWLCLSPKKFLPPLDEYYEKAHELKVIIYNATDFAWAEMHAARCPEHVELYFQTEWSRRDRFTAEIVQYVKDHPRWKLSMQTHKYIDIP